MASGHVNRRNRPNTWLHRPTLRREVFPCQLGAVHTWRIHAAERPPRSRSFASEVGGIASVHGTVVSGAAVVSALWGTANKADGRDFRPPVSLNDPWLTFAERT
jgi:hypothetical protein